MLAIRTHAAIIAGLLLGGCGSMVKTSPGDLVAQRVPPESTGQPVQTVAQPVPTTISYQDPSAVHFLPAGAQVCLPADLLRVQLPAAAGSTQVPVPTPIQRPEAKATDESTGNGTPAADLERLQDLALQLLDGRS